MYPDYYPRGKTFRNLYLLERDRVYDRRGNRAANLDDAGDLAQFLGANRGWVFTGSLTNTFALQFLPGLVDMDQAKVLANQKGKPLAARIQWGRESRWVIKTEVWNEVPEPGCLNRMWDIYEHCEEGFAPTPSSLGNRLMLRSYERHHHGRKHTAPSMACELFLRKYAVGGVVYYPGIGQYDSLQYMDMKSAYLSKYWMQPDGTAIRVVDGYVEGLATYFCQCSVTIYHELPLGPFPQRIMKGHKSKVAYPTLPGRYENVYLWREQVEACKRAGCSVEVYHGFGWKDFTADNLEWCQDTVRLRKMANSEHVEKKSKGLGVAAIGHHGMNRDHYVLVDENHRSPLDRPVLNEDGDAFGYYVHPEYDNRSALMVHWAKYAAMMTNLAVYYFALPFAIQGRLVSMDFDSIMVLEGDDKHQYIRKYSVEDMAAPAGSWIYRLLHNVNVIADRTFESDEMTRKPGVKKDVEFNEVL